MRRIVDRLEQLGMDGSDSFRPKGYFRNTAFLASFKDPNIAMDRRLEERQVIGEMAPANEDTYLDTFLLRDIFETRPESSWDVAAAVRDFPAFRRFQKALISAADEGRYAESLAAFTPSNLEPFDCVVKSIFGTVHRRFAHTVHGRLG